MHIRHCRNYYLIFTRGDSWFPWFKFLFFCMFTPLFIDSFAKWLASKTIWRWPPARLGEYLHKYVLWMFFCLYLSALFVVSLVVFIVPAQHKLSVLKVELLISWQIIIINKSKYKYSNICCNRHMVPTSAEIRKPLPYYFYRTVPYLWWPPKQCQSSEIVPWVIC